MTERDLALRFLAVQAVAREAGRLARRYYDGRRSLVVESKGRQDVVSIADREVETLIGTRLLTAFEGDGFLGEEGGLGAGAETRGHRLWVVDPIDGTANFLRGIGPWAVSIAYMVEGEVELGCVYDPVADELYAARRGAGACRDGVAIRVSACNEMAKATVSIGFSYRRPVAAHVALVQRALEGSCEYRRTGAGSLGMAHVADGRFDAYVEPHINAWDVLAGYLLVREAGGWTNDFLADGGLAHGNPIVACTPGLRDALIAALGVA